MVSLKNLVKESKELTELNIPKALMIEGAELTPVLENE
jgi:hypothetical protein